MAMKRAQGRCTVWCGARACTSHDLTVKIAHQHMTSSDQMFFYLSGFCPKLNPRLQNVAYKLKTNLTTITADDAPSATSTLI